MLQQQVTEQDLTATEQHWLTMTDHSSTNHDIQTVTEQNITLMAQQHENY